MIFHQPDPSFKTLASCWRRATRYGNAGDYAGHPLATAWANVKWMNTFETLPQPIAPGVYADDADFSDGAFSLVLMDGFADKVDAFLKTNMLDGDSRLHAILHEWKQALTFDPTKVNQ